MWTNELIQLITIVSAIAGVSVALIVAIVYVAAQKKSSRYIEKFSDYRSVLEYHMERAYGMIHKEHILTYSLDAFRIEDDQYNKISQEFVRLVQKFIGPRMQEEFVYLYGDENTFAFNILEYFSDKYEGDEIRNAALEQITETEPDQS